MLQRWVIGIICGSHEVRAWFEDDKVRNMLIRVIPAPTSDFKSQISALNKHVFNKDTFDIRRREEAEYIKRYYEYSLSQYNGEISDSLPVPNHVVYNDENSKHLFEEYEHSCVPQFFCYAKEKDLLNYKNIVLHHGKQSYFMQSPLEFTKNRAYN